MPELWGMPWCNHAAGPLRKLLKSEWADRSWQNVVQVRPFAEVLERTILRVRNRTVEAVQVIENIIQRARGSLELTNDEQAFYDALETNDSTVLLSGD